jgi:hypothetical protein
MTTGTKSTTKTTQHTPGPWHVEKDTTYRRPNDGEQTYDNDSPIRIADEGGWIAELAYINGPEDADARLIAAAPDLLEALKEISGTAHNYADGSDPLPVPMVSARWLITVADAAIAKAEGA